MNEINHGGLTRLTECTFTCALQCWRVFTVIKSSSLTTKLLSAASHRTLFCKIMDRATDGYALLVDDNYCFNGHNLKTLIVRHFFNCIAKNLVRELTSKAIQHHDNSSRKRKISKLQSATKVILSVLAHSNCWVYTWMQIFRGHHMPLPPKRRSVCIF